ncbi:hypothetical protein HK101_009227 [Irineochytrium annulatum]|nr:hypothetical protein HK101_009227 [Irineochytrium annulatum]
MVADLCPQVPSAAAKARLPDSRLSCDNRNVTNIRALVDDLLTLHRALRTDPSVSTEVHRVLCALLEAVTAPTSTPRDRAPLADIGLEVWADIMKLMAKAQPGRALGEVPTRTAWRVIATSEEAVNMAVVETFLASLVAMGDLKNDADVRRLVEEIAAMKKVGFTVQDAAARLSRAFLDGIMPDMAWATLKHGMAILPGSEGPAADSEKGDRRVWRAEIGKVLQAMSALVEREKGLEDRAIAVVDDMARTWLKVYGELNGYIVAAMAKFTTTASGIRGFRNTIKRKYGATMAPEYYHYLVINMYNASGPAAALPMLEQEAPDVLGAKHTMPKTYIALLQAPNHTEESAVLIANACQRYFDSGAPTEQKATILFELMRLGDQFFSANFTALRTAIMSVFARCTEEDRRAWSPAFWQDVTWYLVRRREMVKVSEWFRDAREVAKTLAKSESPAKVAEGARCFGTVCNSMAFAYSNIGDFAGAKAVVDLMHELNYKINIKTYTVLLDAFGYSHPVDAVQWFNEMEGMGVKPDVYVYSTMLSRYVQAGRIEFALDILRRMNAAGVQPNVVTFNALISGLAKAGKMAEAMAVINRMRVSNIKPDHISYNSLISASLSRGRWAEAYKYLDEMLRSGIRMGQDNFNAIISAHAIREGGDPAEGRRLLDVMRLPPYSLELGPQSYLAAMRLHLARRDWDAAETMVINMEKGRRAIDPAPGATATAVTPPLPDSRMYSILVRTFAENGLLDRADAVMERISNLPRMQSVSREALAALVRAAGKEGDLARAMGYFGLMRANWQTAGDNAFGAVVSAHVACEDPWGGINFVESLCVGMGHGRAMMDGAPGEEVGTVAVGATEDASESDFTSLVSGRPVIGRATTYALMLAHAKLGDAAAVDRVFEQVHRIEAWLGTRQDHDQRNSLNEKNVRLQCCMLLKQGDAAMEIWEGMWMKPPKGISPSPVDTLMVFEGAEKGGVTLGGGSFAWTTSGERIVSSSSSSFLLSDRFGVDRITVSLILDAMGYCGRLEDVKRVWAEVAASKFRLDHNNWVSYAEALARCGCGADAAEAIVGEEGMIAKSGIQPVAKAWWAIVPLLGAREHVTRMWGVLVEEYPELEGEIRMKLGKWALKQGGWLPELGWCPPTKST